MEKETLEEVAYKKIVEIGYKSDKQYYKFLGLIQFGAKWQQEQDNKMYSEEDLDMFRKFMIQEQNFSKHCLDVFIEQL
jgi:hypothetical protein